MYMFMGKEFDNEKDAIIEWSKQSETFRNGYTIFHNKSSMHTYKVKSKEVLKNTVRGMNRMEVKFPKSNNVYMYRSFDRIDFDKIECVTFVETRGIYGNIASWVRVYNINGELVAIC